jgi:hypothetical protein
MVSARRLVEEADAHQLPALIDEWRDTPLARALAIDLALLEARPELVLPCVYRRCGLLDPLDIPRPWLRSLRSVADAGVLEEYRTSARGRLAFSRDASCIGVDGAIAWERATGRRVDPRCLVPIGMASSPVPRDWADATHAHSIAYGLMVAQLYDHNEEPSVALLDVIGERIAWQLPGEYRCAARDGDRVIIGGWTTIAKHELATGRRVSLTHGRADEIVLGSDRSVAVRAGPVIRLYDLDAPSQPPLPTAGPVAAMFSPDGRRLLTGCALCDGRTGALIAELPLDHPSPLEGGPARDNVHVADDLVLEIMPDGLRAWHVEDGRFAFHDPEQRARHVHHVRFDDAPPADPEGTIADGLLEWRGAAIPFDDAAITVSRDGRYIASRTSHYCFEG